MSFPSVQGYKILRTIGQGGMGSVYLAEDETLGRLVAIKFIVDETESGPEGKERFLREARTMASVDHPHVVHIYSFGEADAKSYIVMQYVEGVTLADLLKSGPLSIPQTLTILQQIVEGLDAAWQKNIVHRDIKPSNILLNKSDQVLVADFGLAKPVHVEKSPSDESSSLTSTGLLLGTPYYMSPEQAQGGAVDFRSDIYSLGIVLYEMLAGDKPFLGTTPVAIVAQHINSKIPNIRTKRPEIPSGLGDLLEKMTEKVPQDRPSYPTIVSRIHEIQTGKITHLRKLVLSRGILVSMLVLAISWAVWVKHIGHQRQVRQAAERSFVIMLAPFRPAGMDAQNEAQVMRELLYQKLTDILQGQPGVQIITPDIVAPGSHDEAYQSGKDLDADVVVWGNVLTLKAETAIQPHIAILEKHSKQESGAPKIEALHAEAMGVDQLSLREAKAEDVAGTAATLAAMTIFRNNADQALKVLEKVNSVDSMSYRAKILMQQGKYLEARTLIKSVLERDPSSALAHALVGADCVKRMYSPSPDCDAQTAEYEFKTALDLQPDQQDALTGLTSLYWERAKYKESIPLILRLKALGERAYDTDALATAYEWAGQDAAATQALRGVITSSSGDCGVCPYLLLWHGEYELVQDFYKAHPPTSTLGYSQLISVQAATGRYDDAQGTYREALRGVPSSQRFLARMRAAFGIPNDDDERLLEPEVMDKLWLDEALADVYLQQGRYQEVRALFDRHNIPWSDQDDVNDRVGLSYVLEGRFDEGLSFFQHEEWNFSWKIVRYMLLKKLGRAGEADRLFSEVSSSHSLEPVPNSANVPPRFHSPISAFLDVIAGKVHIADITRAVVVSDFDSGHCKRDWYAHLYYYLGTYYVANGDIEKAKDFLQKCLENRMRGTPEWLLARKELQDISSKTR